MKASVKFAKVRPDAIIPSKRVEDAGFDLYANFEEDYIRIEPHETKLIPTGIASVCSSDYALVLFERGSTGSKGMARRAGIVDSSYRGEIFVGITNTNHLKTLFLTKLSEEDTIDRFVDDYATKIHKPANKAAEAALRDEAYNWIAKNGHVLIYPYSKAIAQALVIPVPEVEVEELSYEDLKAIPSERGLGSLGSSGK